MTTMTSVSIGKKPSAITLTDGAIAKVADLLAQEGNDALALRVAVRPGGCSGYSYEMFFDSETVRRRRGRASTARSRWSSTRPAPSCSRVPPSSTPTACRVPGSTSRTPTPPAPAGAVPPSAEPTRRRRRRRPRCHFASTATDVEVPDDGDIAPRRPARASRVAARPRTGAAPRASAGAARSGSTGRRGWPVSPRPDGWPAAR